VRGMGEDNERETERVGDGVGKEGSSQNMTRRESRKDGEWETGVVRRGEGAKCERARREDVREAPKKELPASFLQSPSVANIPPRPPPPSAIANEPLWEGCGWERRRDDRGDRMEKGKEWTRKRVKGGKGMGWRG
jgi:hypothetical protein